MADMYKRTPYKQLPSSATLCDGYDQISSKQSPRGKLKGLMYSGTPSETLSCTSFPSCSSEYITSRKRLGADLSQGAGRLSKRYTASVVSQLGRVCCREHLAGSREPPSEPLLSVRAPCHRPKRPCRKAPVCSSAASTGNQDPETSASFLEASDLDPGLAGRAVVVVALVAFSLVLCNADRAIMSVAILPLAKRNGWGESVAGIVQSSFLWGYLFTPVLGGALADKLGGRQVLAAGILLWSTATLFTPWAANHSLTALLTTRAIMGFGEGVALPCMNNLMARWVGKSARARAVGICMAGFHVGSMAGLLAAPPLMGTKWGVGGPFYLFGVLGFVWLTTWLALVPDSAPLLQTVRKPSEVKVSGNRAAGEIASKRIERKGGNGGYVEAGYTVEAITGQKVGGSQQIPRSKLPPFRLLLSKAPTWAIIVANSVNNWGYFILLSWMPLYFSQVLKADVRSAASFAALPWAVMAVAGYAAAVIADALAVKGLGVTAIRKIMQSIGNVGPAVAIFVMLSSQSPAGASLWLTLALGLSSFTQAGFLVNYQDIGPQYAGVLHGLSNTAGTLAGIAGTASTGYLVERTGSWKLPLLLTSGLYLVSTLIWNLFATGERVFE